MDWDIDFITYDNFKKHVKNTINHYGEKLESYDIKRFNKNIIDPIKMIFDKAVYGSDWQTLISNEIFRQRDKTNNNEIGYFHQRLFDYFKSCHVPKNGTEGGWDVIYRTNAGYQIKGDANVHRIYVEMKNKHNTMNSSAASKTYIKMQHQLLEDDDCACFLVEAIAKRSQDIPWSTTVDGKKVSHKRIRRVSIDKFYEIVTGDKDAFYKICMALPIVVDTVIKEMDSSLTVPKDTVYTDLAYKANKYNCDGDMAMYLAMYMLGFHSYSGFERYQEIDN